MKHITELTENEVIHCKTEAMTQFITPPKQKERFNEELIGKVIDSLNDKILADPNGFSWSVNTGLNALPQLNETELIIAKGRAEQSNMDFAVVPDNYNTITYTLTRIEP